MKDIEDMVKKFNEAMAPMENAFMAQVIKFREIGYGRMKQLIQKHWDIELEKDYQKNKREHPEWFTK